MKRVSFHLLLAAFPEDVQKQTRLLLRHLENFKCPSEKKTGPKQHSVLCCGEWASSVAMKPLAMFTFTSSAFGYKKRIKISH